MRNASLKIHNDKPPPLLNISYSMSVTDWFDLPWAAFFVFPRKMAEERGSRTHQGRGTPLTEFEVRAPHRGANLFLINFHRPA